MERKPKYGIGDKVKVVNYGSLIWESKNCPDQEKLSFPLIYEDEKFRYLDMSSKLVGQSGLIDSVNITQGKPQYSISGIEGKHAWYDEGQLELISKNPNNTK